MNNPDFSSLFRQFRDQVPSRKLQRDVATAIEQCLEEVKDKLTYWEKSYLASAISALAWNLRSKRSPTDAWLRLALVNAERALVVPSKRNDNNYTPKDDTVNSFTYEELKTSIEQLKAEIGVGD